MSIDLAQPKMKTPKTLSVRDNRARVVFLSTCGREAHFYQVDLGQSTICAPPYDGAVQNALHPCARHAGKSSNEKGTPMPDSQRFFDGKQRLAQVFLTAVLATLILGLSGCGYNAIQTEDEQVKASWSEVLNQY